MSSRKYRYIYFGAKIESEIEFENLKEEEFDTADIIIRAFKDKEDNSFKLGITITEDKIVCRKRKYTTVISNGKQIELFGEFSEEEPWLKHIVFESWMLYIWLQRGCIVFHGSVCEVNGKALILMGDGGMGKSTLSYYFAKQGHKKMSDDLAVIFKEESAGYQAVPASIKQNLTKESVDIFGLDSSSMDKMEGEEKYTFFIENSCKEPKKIDKIFFLEKNSQSRLEFTKINGFSKLNYLLQHIQQLGNIREIEKGSQRHMKYAGELASTVEMYKISRPEGKNTIEEIYKRIIEVL